VGAGEHRNAGQTSRNPRDIAAFATASRYFGKLDAGQPVAEAEARTARERAGALRAGEIARMLSAGVIRRL